MGGIGIRLLPAPQDSGYGAQGRIYVVDHVAPGTVITRQVQVSNSSPSTVHIVVYAGAAFVAKGSFVGAVGHTPDAVSSWTSVQPSSSELPVRGLMTATVTISVPSTAPAGEQYGVIWAETRSAAVDGITQVSRVGVRVYLVVGAGGLAPANFSIGSLYLDQSTIGRTTVLGMVHNTGGWPLDVSGTLRLTDGPGGLSTGPLPVRIGSTLPVGGSELAAVALNSQIPAGHWDLRMSLQGGGIGRSVETSLTVPGTSAHSGKLVPAVVLVVVLMGIAALLIHLRRRRSRGRHSRHSRHSRDVRPAIRLRRI
jgi:hypothetical protein